MEPFLTITEVARRTGLSAHTLRYYERAGLIAPVARACGGQRRYAAADLDWIGFLLRLRETRMPIERMLAFARLRSRGEGTAPERRQMLQTHLADVLNTIATMQQAALVLEQKIAHYQAMEAALSANPPTPERGNHDCMHHHTDG